jgi:N-acetyl-anhydromuramyl-L-alanine amidase AmpD
MWPFIQAKHFTLANRSAIRLIVIHSMESPEKPDTAEAVAMWFAGLRGEAPRASAHACVDSNSLVRCVPPEHVAWHAPGANRDGYGIEHAGVARQSAEQWADEYSQSMLRISAQHAAEICHLYHVPALKLSPADLIAGRHGICGHADVNAAYHLSSHYDPGPHFPWSQYIAMVRENLERIETGEELDARDPDTEPRT